MTESSVPNKLSDDDVTQLNALCTGQGVPPLVAKRARLVLAFWTADPHTAIGAKSRSANLPRINRWVHRYNQYGIDGLDDAPRSGAPRRISNSTRASIVSLGSSEGPNLSSRQIAAAKKVSQSSVSRILRQAINVHIQNTAPSAVIPDENPIEEIVLDLFESLADDNPWQRFLGALKRVTGSEYATILIWINGHSKVSLVIADSDNIDEGRASYKEVHYLKERFTGFVDGRVCTLSDMIPIDQLRSDEFYINYLRLYDLGYILGIDIGAIRGVTASLRLSRLEKLGDFGADERRLCRTLLPYLRTALNLFVRRSDAEAERAALATTVSSASVGSIIVDPDGQLIDANPLALDILKQRDGLYILNHRIVTEDSSKTKLLAELIRLNAEAAIAPRPSRSARTLLVDRPSGRESLGLLIRPAPGVCDHKLIRPTALIHVIDTSQPRVRVTEAMMEMFGLTPSEAMVALSISNGHTIEEIAQMRATRPCTIRSQLRAIFGKMGVSRQSSLVRTILLSSALLTLPSEI